MTSEMKPTANEKTKSDANSTIMRPVAKPAAAPAKTVESNVPHIARMESKQTEKAVEKAVEKAIAETPQAPATETKAPAKEAKAPAKPMAATKSSKKEEKTETTANASMGKPYKKKGKKAVWVKKTKIKKDSKTKKSQSIINEKWKPNFWGRFGKKNLRTQRDPKYAKWRKPRGIDILRERNDGELPNSGFQTPKAIRFVHPSGYREVFVQSKKDLDNMKPLHAARFSRTIGRKKRIELIQYAATKNIPILN